MKIILRKVVNKAKNLYFFRSGFYSTKNYIPLKNESILFILIEFSVQVAIPDANTLVQNATHHVFGNYTGLLSQSLEDNLWPKYARDYTTPHGDLANFASVFGVLFSGVTGIMAGANMSGKKNFILLPQTKFCIFFSVLGELKNPSKNIPRGTLSAVLFTFIIYITVSVLTAATCSRYLLQNNFLFMIAVNKWPICVAIGLLTATFSASLSNLIGSSRVLEALAKDQVFGKYKLLVLYKK